MGFSDYSSMLLNLQYIKKMIEADRYLNDKYAMLTKMNAAEE